MKSERRHELHENMVSQFFSECLAFIRKNANALSWGLLVVAVVALVAVLWNKHSEKKEGEQQAEFETVVLNPNPEAKPDEILARRKAVLQNDSNKFRLAVTTYAIGQEYSRQALMASGQQKKELDDQAVQYYSQVVEKYPTQPMIVGKAHMAMAKIAEGRGDWSKAQEEYQAVQMMGSLAGYPLRDFAEEARKAMEQYKQPVAFATTEPSTQASSSSAPSSGPSTASAPAK